MQAAGHKRRERDTGWLIGCLQLRRAYYLCAFSQGWALGYQFAEKGSPNPQRSGVAAWGTLRTVIRNVGSPRRGKRRR
jgi:hypothetical protein